MPPVIAASVSLSPSRLIALRIASSKSVLSRNAIIATFREVGAVDEACFDEVQADFKRRGGRK
ncbi:hypothetical protein FACS1894188_13310 [Clostridia bacterium]|nr:hypothetical protein FACS1894188_13310 [Clostridia bacterium]